jgi:hypothetical protein
LLGLVCLLYLYRLSLRWPGRDERPRSTVPFMNDLLDRLESLGWKRRPSQTPAELIEQVETATQGQWRLGSVLKLYYHVRFSGDPPSTDELRRAGEIIRGIK